MPSIVWKGHLTFGLVSVPVKLFRAARRERVRLHYVRQDQPPELTSQESPSNAEGFAQTAFTELSRRESLPPTAEPAPTPPIVSRLRQTIVSSGDEQPISRADVL